MKRFFDKVKDQFWIRYLILIVSLLLIIYSDYLYRSGFAAENEDNIKKRITDYIRENDEKAAILAESFLKKLPNENLREKFDESFASTGIGIFIYQNDSLVYWNNNRIGLNRHLQRTYTRHKVVKLANNWLRLLAFTDASKKKYVIAAYIIKRDYPFQNEFIQRGFDENIKINSDAQISLQHVPEGISVLTSGENKEHLFTLILPPNEEPVSRSTLLALAILIGCGILFMVWFLLSESEFLEKYIGIFQATILFVISILGLRFLMLYTGFPTCFTEFELFQPTLFATSFLFPSLGDFMINILLLFYICYHIYNKSHVINIRDSKNKIVQYGLFTILFLIIVIYPFFINGIISGLIQDSNINFNVNNIFDLSAYSILGITIIGILFFSYLLITDVFVSTAVKLDISKLIFVGILLFSFILSYVYYQGKNETDLLVISWPIVLNALMAWVHYRKGTIFSFNNVVLLLIIFSFYTAHTVTRYSEFKEWEERKVIMTTLATDEDPDTEYKYAKLEKEILKSDLIQKPFNKHSRFNKTAFEREMEEEYFKSSWGQFDIQFYLFDKDSTPLGIEGFAPIREFTELDDIIADNGIPSGLNPNIYFIYNSFSKLSYVIKLPIGNDNEIKGYLFCELRSKKIPEDIGFPELLLDKSNISGGRSNIIRKYSFARYIDGKQVARFGEYNYSLTGKVYERDIKEGEYYTFSEGNYHHMALRMGDRFLMVMGIPEENFMSKATTFSYLFTLLCLLLLIGMLIRQISSGQWSLQLTLQGKIQFLLASVLLFSLVLFGIGTRYFISGQYEEKNKRIISEKLQSVRIEVSHKVGNEDVLEHDLQNYLTYILEKFSHVFITDINLYNTRGELLASSRPKIFTTGLLSTQMNPEAFRQLSIVSKSEVIQEEKIGRMLYLSGYIPLINNNGKLIGFINLPYFSKQTVLQSEYSSFLVAIINIFILLFAISLLAALFVSNWITKPLRILQQNLSSIQLGKSNQTIDYKGNDEIASLVQEYNNKVIELEKYASELARSERESAWREMAKQVAHEIKNPLTPMRLTIQHAQRSLKQDDPNYEEKLEKFATTLIEQIDTLSHIANEFSNFAKMPKAVDEKLDLIQILESTVELYKETPDVQIRFHKSDITTAEIMGDKEQLLRVTGNLVKNAIQSIPDGKEGKIDVYVRQKENGFVFEVKDNGSGIEPEKIDQIFTPNFTTKSTGMGLGLAMVKNIVESSGGKIWFETSQGHGTSFFVLLPLYQ